MPTIENLQTEIEKLRAKNAQLLDEKKRAVAAREEVKQQLEAMTAEKDEVAQELERITIHQPRLDLIEEVAAPGMADTLLRELTHHFDIVNVDGRDMLHHKDGTSLTISARDDATGQEVQKPLAFDSAGLDALHENKILTSLGHLLNIPTPKGAGTQGNRGHLASESTYTSKAKPSPFGLK